MSMKLTALLLLVTASAFAGCAGAESQRTGANGAGGGIGAHCTTIACVPAVTGSLSLAIEIDPPTNATTATITELPTVELSVEPIPSTELMAAAQANVSVFFTATANAAAPSSASVVLTVPTAIPGRPDLTFQAPTVGGASASVISTSLTVPQTAVTAGETATLALIPLPPADQQSPPYSFPVTLAPMLAESIPSDDFTISGTLLSAYGTPPMATFVARAYQDGAVVSNAPVMPGGITTGTDPFKLLLPSAVAANGDPLTVQLTPQGQTPADPWFASTPIAPQVNTTALAVTLPAYSNLNQFNVIVKGDDGTAVSGALVHAQTVVGTSTLGSTEFARDGLTDVNGTVVLSLLPGTAQAALNYQITVVPPANSAFAIPCDSPVAVTVGGSTTTTIPAPTLTTIILVARPTLVGTVRDDQGYPLSNVAITATQETPDNASCTSATPAPASATTAADGTFILALDPGTYQIDYDPPVGSAAPRFTEYGVHIAGSASVTHDETLPQGAAVSGIVVDPNGVPLPSATVRLFQVRCMGGADCTGPDRTAPSLRAVTVTDANGYFQVAVANSATP
jgi:hypothetical protein